MANLKGLNTGRRTKGFRRPQHVGSRLMLSTDESKCLAAQAILPGETVISCRIDALATTKDSAANFDQPPVFTWMGLFVPWTLALDNESITSVELDGFFSSYFSEGAGMDRLGGETAYSTDNLAYEGYGDLGTSELWFIRQRIGRPVPVGKDTLDNDDARFFDEFSTNVSKRLHFPTAGWFLFGVRQFSMAAQTNFGVENLDDSVDASVLLDVYSGNEEDAGGNGLAAATVLFGGDNYIEADSLKNLDVRAHALVSPVIRMNTALIR